MQPDMGLIIAIIAGTVTIVGVMITMLLWLRSESRTDWRNLQDQIISDRREMIQITRNIENTMQAIQAEAKDFHYRLLEIERARKS